MSVERPRRQFPTAQYRVGNKTRLQSSGSHSEHMKHGSLRRFYVANAFVAPVTIAFQYLPWFGVHETFTVCLHSNTGSEIVLTPNETIVGGNIF